MKKDALLFFSTVILLLFVTKGTWASHALGGEITYTHVQGLTYRINITLYTSIPSPQNGDIDRPTLDSVHVGEGIIMTFTRDTFVDFPNDIRVNHYSEMHTYTGVGTNHIFFVTPNRVGNICNIPNSFFTPFAIEAELIVNGPMCPNSSVSFADKPIFFARNNKLYAQNVNAVNIDHDSISFEFVPCLGQGLVPIPDYSFPPHFKVDSISGMITVDSMPDTICKWAFAIKVSDWKNGMLAGYVMRDYLLEVLPDTDTTYFFSPAGNAFSITDSAGMPLSSSFYYVDNSGAGVNVYGEAYSANNSPTTAYTNGISDTVFQTTTWTPDFFRPRPSPYIFVYRGGSDTRQTDITVLVYVTGAKYDSCYSSLIDVPEINGEGNLISIFPNPASNQFSLQLSNGIHKATGISIYNSIGELMLQQKNPEVSIGVITISTKNFPSGFYFVKVEGENFHDCAKVCVMNN